ncbi:cytochrome P450 [Frankia sp. Cppng1_Ct_nod]|uniref:cytochrome P450 n=1 Tax=Frankia sp. Cppng1_Ct_nod TaxID=2897162 RepID=UPI0010411880|nr:cytochrome P450 [Frankia sp. Cppng1_Ct_nod]
MTATVPGVASAPGRLPLLGHVHRMLSEPRRFFESLRDAGDIVTIGLGPARAYVINNPVWVHQILTRDVRKLDKGIAYEKSAPFLGNGLLNSTEPTHMAHRRLMQPAFHATRIAGYADQMREVAEQRASAWRDGQVVEFVQEIHTFAVAVVCRALFSSDLGDSVAVEVEQTFPVLLKGVARRIAFPVGWLEKLPTPGNRRFDRARNQLDKALTGVITQYRERGAKDGDLMAMLLAARADGDRPGLSDQQIHDEAMALFLGGVETARDVLSWTCHLLSRHPDIQERLAAEVATALAGRSLDHTALADLTYLRQVLSEALRLYPPGWLLSRRTVTEVVLGEYRIPPGCNVLFSLHAIQRDPAVYTVPDVFDPDRWAGDGAAAIPRTSFLPFGTGNRSCIGEPFAWEEMTIFVAAVIARWKLHPSPGYKVRPSRSTMLQPKRVPLIVRARRPIGTG